MCVDNDDDDDDCDATDANKQVLIDNCSVVAADIVHRQHPLIVQR